MAAVTRSRAPAITGAGAADGFDPAHHPQQIAARDPRQRRVGIAAPVELGDQMRKARHVLETARLRTAEEVRADADVVDPDPADEVVDVVAQLFERRDRLRPGTADVIALRSVRLGRAPLELAEGVGDRPVPVPDRLRDEVGHEGDHDEPGVRGDALQHVVGHVAGMVAQRGRVRMRPHDRRGGFVEHVVHGVRGHMGEIDDDPEPVEFAHQRPAEGAQSVRARRVGRAVDPGQRLVVAERDEAHARGVPDAQGAERAFEPDRALDRQERGDQSAPTRPRHVRGARRVQEHVRMGDRDVAREVDLFEREPSRRLRRGRHIGRPELRRDLARPKTRDVGVVARVVPGHVEGPEIAAGAMADHDRQIVVPVDQRDAIEQRERMGEGGIGHAILPRTSRARRVGRQSAAAASATSSGLSPCPVGRMR